VTGAALALVGIWRSTALPLRHAVLVGALMVAVGSPLVLGTMWLSGVAAIELPLEPDAAVSAAMAIAINETAVAEPVAADAEIKDDALIATPTDAFIPGFIMPESATTDVVATIPAGAVWSWAALARMGAFVWAVGSLASLASLAVGLLWVRRLRACCRQLALPRVMRLRDEAARNLGMTVVPDVYSTALVDSPLSLGVCQPCVVLPEDAVKLLDDEQMRGLLMHELAHVARRDHLVGLLQRAALVVYWWNPLLRRVSSTVSTLREEICDDLATHRAASGDTYAAMLVELAGRAVSRRSLPTAIGMFDGSRRDNRGRVERLVVDGR
jgi:beta-lactamase regulating signal transducer with metallopeptidase domain